MLAAISLVTDHITNVTVICFVLFVVLSVLCFLFLFYSWLCIKLPLRDDKDTLYLVPCTMFCLPCLLLFVLFVLSCPYFSI